jgi:cytochrome c oxidase cbb3-type subunit 4
MTYEIASHFAQTWGLVFLVVAFLVALGYALWPGNRGKFQRAAQLPLNDEEPPAVAGSGPPGVR